ncbi:MAG: hypothetical protein FD177_26 [Desulfovibrionaceae bacterium]|nr:MAG: hypothetical protein FD177_26 [Desulfovibrionaceae bacterium]
MREFTETEHAVLRIIEQFGNISKYQGITPEEYLVGFRGDVLRGLIKDDILEKVKLKSFSQRVKGLRFTSQGEQIWRLASHDEVVCPPVADMDLLLRDIFLRTRLSYTEEAVPKAHLLKYHSKASLLEAYQLGLVAKVKIKQKQHDVVKGYIATSAGYAWLRGNKLI